MSRDLLPTIPEDERALADAIRGNVSVEWDGPTHDHASVDFDAAAVKADLAEAGWALVRH